MPQRLNQIQKRFLTIGILAVALYLLNVFEDYPAAASQL
jgi:hypothetical protein